MAEITVKGDFKDDEMIDQAGADGQGYSDTFTAEVQVLHWNTQIGDVQVGAGDTQTVASTTACTLKAKAFVDAQEQTSGPVSFTTDSDATVVANIHGTSVMLTVQAATTSGKITFSNESSVPVQFFFIPSDASTQSYMVEPKSKTSPLDVASQWQASGTVKDKYVDIGGGGGTGQTYDYSLASITFDDANATLSVVQTKGGFELKLT